MTANVFLNTRQALAICLIVFMASCSTPGPSGLFGKRSPHDEYGDKIKTAGLTETSLGRQWFAAADRSIASPLTVNLPYSETGYFPADEPKATGLIFKARRGEKVSIKVTKKPATGFLLYLDLWQAATTADTKPKFILSADTTLSVINLNVDNDQSYLLRLQPELLKGGEYTLTISTGPSLAFPVSPKFKSNIGSFWGASRDNGGRKHEGIDIFAVKRAELVAAANGIVTRVNENALGGKVVFLNPEDRNISIYYAHLDEQLVRPGQAVKTGDVIGLMGNTGNAKSTSPHLHFGIYTTGGAIDPLPFVNKVNRTPEKITAPMQNLDQWVRVSKPATLFQQPSTTTTNLTIKLDAGTLLKAEAATADWYKVTGPGGEQGFVLSSSVVATTSPIRKANLKTTEAILDYPDVSAARKTVLSAGEQVNILATYKDFYYISKAGKTSGWINKRAL